MASIQPKMVNGRKYWQIVQSQRVNGKPRPIVLEHLGTADSLLNKLRNRKGKSLTVKSYSHGLVAVLLKVAEELNIVELINNDVESQRKYFAGRPIRNNLTVGATLLLAAIGRVCKPTSKDGWYAWAKQTSLSYLLRMDFSKLDSQHFWDMMDSLPEGKIGNIELNLLKNIKNKYTLDSDTLFYDTTNFYTFINTTNIRCTIAQRGKNKQKRTDLRQVGLAMVVSRKDLTPIFHETYQGNKNDSTIFRNLLIKIRKRLLDLGMNVDMHTIVFDRGCNAKKNLEIISNLKMHYVGALTPFHHKALVNDAENNFKQIIVNGNELSAYRDKRSIWGEERTVLVYISEKLKAGQLRGIYSTIEKQLKSLEELNKRLANPRSIKFTRKNLINKIDEIISMPGTTPRLIDYGVSKKKNKPYVITCEIDKQAIANIEDKLGFRIIMTNRHNWTSSEIINAYQGQSFIENAFKNIKSPIHLALTPEFHWTDQKIKIHFFTCVMGYMLTTILWKKIKEIGYNGSMTNFLEMLSGIRLANILEYTGKKNKPQVNYQIELMDEHEEKCFEALNGLNIHKQKIKIDGFSLYKN